MGPSFKRSVVEAAFFIVLVALIAALHSTRDFHSAFAYFASDLVAVQQTSSLHNYLSLLAVTFAAYLAARGACTAALRLPASVRSSPWVKVALVVLAVPTVSWALFIAAGSPPLDEHVATRWLVRNWEQSAKKDAAWCARLFILLLWWQALLAAVVTICGTCAGVIVILVRFCVEKLTGGAYGGGGMKSRLSSAPRELEVSTGMPTQQNGHGSSQTDAPCVEHPKGSGGG